MSLTEASSSNKDLKVLLRLARKQQWRILTTGKHLKWYAPDGTTLIVTAASPSDKRALMNIRRDLRQGGLKF